MKKNLTIILAIALSFGVFAQQNTWPSALGNVSFATDSIWTISGNGIFQIWSDAVQTDYCSNKTEFDGGVWDWNKRFESFNVDCRSNPDFLGDLFSWRAVNKLGSELCPYPWRVPTEQDFIRLDIALGGTGEFQIDSILRDRYINDWGGAFGGRSYKCGRLLEQGVWARYWSRSEIRTTNAMSSLYFISTFGAVNPRFRVIENYGMSLRCVRDN